MQLTSTPPMPVAAPAAAPAPVPAAAPAPEPSTMSKVMSVLRGTPEPDAAATPPAAAPSAPVEEANFGQQLLGKVGLSQNKYLANQQLLGAISQALTQRIGMIGSHAWAILRGTADQG